MEPITIVRPASAPAYPVFCGGDAPAAVAALWEQRFSRAVIVGDSNTDPLFAPALEEALAAHQPLRLSFPAGEGAKTRATKERLEDAMLAARIDRSACLVAVGGGVGSTILRCCAVVCFDVEVRFIVDRAGLVGAASSSCLAFNRRVLAVKLVLTLLGSFVVVNAGSLCGKLLIREDIGGFNVPISVR